MRMGRFIHGGVKSLTPNLHTCRTSCCQFLWVPFMSQLKILCDTMLKQQPIQSNKLADDQKQAMKAGTLLNIQAYAPDTDHIKVTLADQTFQGKNTWYVFQRHCAVLENNAIAYPTSVKLSLPYFDQLDNSENPYGSCNVTSIAMCLAYLGAKRLSPQQRFPDELDDYCDNHGLDRHDPNALAKVVESYGFHDRFSTTASFDEVKEWLIQGNPAVTHGYFTASGHVIVIIGYNDKGFIVNDPYGELMYSPSSKYYNTYTTGAGLTYSYNLMFDTCCTGNEFWVHFISRS